MTHLNGRFWSNWFRSVFCREITLYCDTVVQRCLPTLDEIAAEAQSAAESEYARFGEMPYTDDGPGPDELADVALNKGIGRFEELSSVRQILLNLFVAGLHHLFEQQLLYFLRRQVLRPENEDDVSLMRVDELCARLIERGLDVKTLQSWRTITELRLVANVVKHAEGRSCGELRGRRPDLFVHPSLRLGRDSELAGIVPVYRPLGGDSIYVTEADVSRYRDELVAFWHEFAGKIETL